jgi:hypothetical protein
VVEEAPTLDPRLICLVSVVVARGALFSLVLLEQQAPILAIQNKDGLARTIPFDLMASPNPVRRDVNVENTRPRMSERHR